MVKQDLRKDVENGVDLGIPDGVLINGLGPYRYDDTLVPNGISYQIINVEPGKNIGHSVFPSQFFPVKSAANFFMAELLCVSL